MGKLYKIKTSLNSLISIEPQRECYRSQKPKEALLDRLQAAYLAVKDRYGINYVPSSKNLLEEAQTSESTFNDNFCGGINGFLSFSEQIVFSVLTQATLNAESGLDAMLREGFRALTAHKKGNYKVTKSKTQWEMSSKTYFAARVFSPEYWQKALEPLFPAIDEFIKESIREWEETDVEIKQEARYLFAASFRFLVEFLAKEDFRAYSLAERASYLNEYISLYKKLLIHNASALLVDRYHIVTEIMRITNRISENEKRTLNEQQCGKPCKKRANPHLPFENHDITRM